MRFLPKVYHRFLVLMLFTFLGLSTPGWVHAQATALALTVSKDGAIPFDADDLAGNDSSSSNGIVRTHDEVEYLVSYNAPASTPIQIVLTLPTGFAWDSTATASNICNGTGGGVISADKTTLTCNRVPVGGIEQFSVKAWVGSVANGSTFTTTLKIGTEQVTSPSLTVSAYPKNEIYTLMQGEGGGSFSKVTINGELGVKFQWVIGVGSMNTSTKGLKGLESIPNPFTYTIKVAPGTVVTACQNLQGGGTRTCTQAAPGGDITVTVNSANLSYLNTATPSYLGTLKALNQTSVVLFTPFGTNFPVGASTPMTMQIKDFDPDSLSGVSNYGTSYATDYDPSKVCPTSGTSNAPGNTRACMLYYVDRTVIVNLLPSFPGAIDGVSNTFIYGDNDQMTNNIGAGAESVLIGQKFRAMAGIYNPNTSEEAVNNVTSCFIWNPQLMELDGTPVLKYRPDPGLQNASFNNVAHLSFPDATGAQYVMEYSSQVFNSDAERRAAKCGVAGNGDAGWSSTPSGVAGGASAVSSIRYKFIPPLNPQDLLGLVVPLVRSASSTSQALASGAPMPWFVNHSSTETGDRQSTYTGANGLYNLGGGRVNAVKALVRHTASVSASVVAPGNALTMNLSPVVIGNVGDDLNSVANSTKITVTMPNACVSPIESSLPAGSVLTPANLGADGVACTADDGAPASVVLNLGDINVPSGSLSASPYQAHATTLAPISFSILAAPSASLQTLTVNSVISSTSDVSPSGTEVSSTPPLNTGRTRLTTFDINGVSAFRVTKTASGLTDGKVGPNEIFTYTINFSNGGTSSTGKGRFVDILPFDGDRNNTTGLGTGKIVVTGLAAAMDNVSMGTVSIETTTDPSSSVETAVTTAGNEDGQTGVNWTAWTTGSAIPSNITAIRFTTSDALSSGYSGYGVIAAKAPTITQSTSIKNTINGRTEPIDNLPATAKVMQDTSIVTITGLDGATLRGNVFYDLNANGTKDVLETGVSGAKVVITCTAGACLSAPQGTVFSLLTDANGAYSFAPNLSNKVFANTTASGTALASFQGVLAGTWSITETPPTTPVHVNVSTEVGTINSIPSGTAAGRTISGVAMVGNGTGENYNFGERLEHGKITVTKSLTLPSNISGPFSFTFTATCNKPVAGSTYSATLSNFPTTTSVDITDIPANSTCVMSESLPTAPTNYTWASPSFTALSPSGVLASSGTQTTTVTNVLNTGLMVSKTVVGSPTAVDGSTTQFDLEYKIEVSNTMAQELTYTLSDTFGFDPDVEVVNAPQLTKSENVGNALNASFTGAGANTSIISNETIDAAVAEVPTVHTYNVKLRINLKGFTTSNNACNATTANGLFNTATLQFGDVTTTSTACANTPGAVPVNLKLRMQWVGGRASSNTKVKVPVTTGFTTANTAEFESTNTGLGNYTDSDTVTLTVGESGVLPAIEFLLASDAQDYAVSAYSCTDGTLTPTEVTAGSSWTLPVEAAGKTLICTITANYVNFAISKTALPASGSSVSVGDTITYTLKTVVSGGASLKDLVLTDTLDTGLTVEDTPANCVLTGQTMVCTLASGAAVGEHSFVYTAEVNNKATSNKVPGVQNKVVANSGVCDPCETQHGMWSVDTSKTSDAAGKKGIEVGQSITYTLTVKVTGGSTTQDVTLKDTRSVGLSVSKVPEGCQQKGLVITCILPSGSPVGQYQFVYTAIVTDDAGDFVTNKVVPSTGTCKTSCQTSIKVLREVMLRITKTTASKVVKIADFVRYELLVENLTGPTARNFYVVDQPAPGLSFVEGSLKVVGDDEWKLKSTYPLVIEQLDLAKGEKIIISYLMRVNAGAARGQLKNTAWVDDVRKYVSSNKAIASVERGIDPDFEVTRIFGKVFVDVNVNGIQDDGELGLAGVRLITTTGWVIETDSFGRFHIDGLDPGWFARGSNFVVKIDESSLPASSWVTTENPLVKRLTPALPLIFNFGVQLDYSGSSPSVTD